MTKPPDRAEPARERVEREDMVMFINACFACTRQQEFYSDAFEQSVSIEFLHAYIHGNYRRLYARTLAAGINHFNQCQVIANLLALGSPPDPLQRREEGFLIEAALKRLPPNRVFKVFADLRRRRVNNRRTRAVIRRYLRPRDSEPAANRTSRIPYSTPSNGGWPAPDKRWSSSSPTPTKTIPPAASTACSGISTASTRDARSASST